MHLPPGAPNKASALPPRWRLFFSASPLRERPLVFSGRHRSPAVGWGFLLPAQPRFNREIVKTAHGMFSMRNKQPPEMTLEEAEAIMAEYRHDPNGPLYSVSYTYGDQSSRTPNTARDLEAPCDPYPDRTLRDRAARAGDGP